MTFLIKIIEKAGRGLAGACVLNENNFTSTSANTSKDEQAEWKIMATQAGTSNKIFKIWLKSHTNTNINLK